MKAKGDKYPLSAQQLDELTEASRYIACTGCENVERFWSRQYNCPVWKCRLGVPNCPRVGNRCPKFEPKEPTK